MKEFCTNGESACSSWCCSECRISVQMTNIDAPTHEIMFPVSIKINNRNNSKPMTPFKQIWILWRYIICSERLKPVQIWLRFKKMTCFNDYEKPIDIWFKKRVTDDVAQKLQNAHLIKKSRILRLNQR